MERNEQIAREILNVLYNTNIMVYWSWGVSQKFIIDKGLRIKVKGHHHKGFVDIILDEGSDTYIVKIVELNGNVKETIEDVYFDNLQEIIDNRIEKISDYQF